MKHNKRIIRLVSTLFSVLLCITCFSTTAFAGGGDEDSCYEEEPTTEPGIEPETRSSAPLTPDGQATVLDNVTDKDGKEFFTFITPNENVFYLVIDRQRDSENVYFLNAVTEEDLMALAEKEKPAESAVPEPEPVCVCEDKCHPGAVKTTCEVCKLNLKDCVGEEAEIPEPVEVKKDSDLGLLLFLALFVLVGGAVGYYFKVYRPKQDFIDDDDAEEYEAEAEEETINEDEDGEVREDDTDPQEVDYYDDYPDETEEEETP